MEVDVDTSDDESLSSQESSVDEESKSRLMEEVNVLESQVTDDPYNYNAYKQLIATLRDLAELDKLRGARNKMSDYFPLTSDLWLEWIDDERKIATSLEENKNVQELFDRAVKDYISVKIWLEYVQYSIGIQPEIDSQGIENVRGVFERALAAAGLHVTEGALLWDAYFEFEFAILSLVKTRLVPPRPSEEETKQRKRIANLYKRQLSCPLLGMDKTYERFTEWVSDNSALLADIVDTSMIEDIYRKSLEKLRKIEPYENDLTADPNNYQQYLEHEKSKEGTPARVLCLYERLLCHHSEDAVLWMEYIDYIDSTLKDEKLVMEVTERSLRNCPWSGYLSAKLLQMLEKYGGSHQDINGAVEQALRTGLIRGTELRQVWMGYLEYMRRRYDTPDISKEEEMKRLDALRAAFNKALDHMSVVEASDPECMVMQYWARVEAKCAKNLEKSRLLWSEIMENPQQRTAVMWLEYINLEMAYGDSKHLKKLFPRALQQTTDWPESIYSAWLNYERDEGTLESYMNCVAKCTARISQIAKQRSDLEKQQQEASNQADKKPKRAGYGPKKEKQNEAKKETVNARKRPLVDVPGSSSPEKKKKVSEDTQDIVDQLLSENNKDHGVTVKHDPSKDNRTVFVSNLDYTTGEDVLREIFDSDGVITDLRLVKDFKGRSKGYCYVEFQKADMALKALKRDRQLIGGRPMFVSRCDPDKETRSSGFRFATSVEKNKLFVRGLPITTTKEELQELFSQYGALKDVRLVVFRNGHSKGLAYVDFEDEVSAAQAILKADGMTIGDKQISVAISNPPKRQKPDSAPIVSSLGGGKKEVGPRGRGRTQISFVPRSVQLNPGTTAHGLEKLTLTSPSAQDGTQK